MIELIFFGKKSHFPKVWRCSSLLFSRMRAAKPFCFDPVSRPCCLPRRLICASGCRWCRRLLNVSFGPPAWFSPPLFLFIYLVYQFVTQMNNGWGRLLPRRHAKLIIVMRLLAKNRSTALPRLLDSTPVTSGWQTSWCIGPHCYHLDWVLAVVHKLMMMKIEGHKEGHVEIHTGIHRGLIRVPKKICPLLLIYTRLFLVLYTCCPIWMNVYHLPSLEWLSTVRSIHLSTAISILCTYLFILKGAQELQTISA